MEEFDASFKSFVDHVYFMSFYGLGAWVVFHYNYRKYQYIKLKKKYSWSKWWHENVSLLFAAVVVSFSVVAWDDEMISLYNGFVEADITWRKEYYLIPPFLTMGILKRIFRDSKI
jgi:hypothetical protein